MACTTDKFVINKSMSNEFIITIKQNDSTLPMVIYPADTFTVNFYNLETQELVKFWQPKIDNMLKQKE